MRVFHVIALVLSTSLLAVTGCTNELDIDQMDLEEPFDDGSNIELQGVYDCTERTDNGYRSGSRFTITVVRVDDRPVEVSTANAYIAMQEAARRAGVNLRIVSGFRTQSEQQYLYGCYVNCNCNSCNLAARPGYSNHQSGYALDLNTRDRGVLTWLNNNASRFGFRRTVPSEDWHWEFLGRASDFDGPCGNGGPSTSVAPDGCTGLGDGILEEDGACMTLGGPSQYLRSVDTEFASGGSLVWTGATANSTAANFAIWWVKVPSPGIYKVEAHINRTYGTSQQAKYSIRHNGRTDVVTMNQTTAGGFRSLGEFQFSGTPGERIRLDDNTGERSSLGRKIVIDAIRITRVEDGQSAQPPAPAACSRVIVDTDGAPLNVRPGPSTAQAARGTIADGRTVERLGTVTNGQEVRGTRVWYEVRDGSLQGFVSGAFAHCVN
jgi:hypothetical protein